MIRSRTVLVALVAVFAMSVLGASSASASKPEFHFFKYPVKFEATSGGATLHRYGGWVGYEGVTVTGEVTAPNSVSNVTATFKNAEAHSFNCWNAEGRKGLVWSGLKGRLGYINKAKFEIGLLLHAEPMAKCEDEFGAQDYMGLVIGRIAPIDRKVKTTERFQLTFARSENKELPEFFEGETESLPENYPLHVGYCHPYFNGKELTGCVPGTEEHEIYNSQVGFSSEMSVKFAQEVEIIA